MNATAEKLVLIVECTATARVGTMVSTHTHRTTVAWSDGSIGQVETTNLREIGEIEYSLTPHEQMCAHSSCLKPLAIWHNVRNEKWYCADCARLLNSGGKIVCYPVED